MKSTNFLCMAGLRLCLAIAISLAQTDADAVNGKPIHVTSFLPGGYVTDGSASYQKQIQQALDSAASTGGEIVFAPMVYGIDDPVGLRVNSNLTLRMEGATFQLGDSCAEDGQLFLGQDLVNVRFQGGTITGRNDVWPEGVNIRGIHLIGECISSNRMNTRLPPSASTRVAKRPTL